MAKGLKIGSKKIIDGLRSSKFREKSCQPDCGKKLTTTVAAVRAAVVLYSKNA